MNFSGALFKNGQWDQHGCTAKRQGISFSLNRNKVVITATQHSHNSWVMPELSCSLTTVRCQSKQCDGKYSGPVQPSHNTVVMSQLELGFPAAVVWWEACGSAAVPLCAGAAFFHCWPSPDSEKCWAGRSYAALEQRTLSTHLHINCTVCVLLRPLYVLSLCATFLSTKLDVVRSIDVSYYTMEKENAFWLANRCPLKFQHILYLHTRHFKLQAATTTKLIHMFIIFFYQDTSECIIASLTHLK